MGAVLACTFGQRRPLPCLRFTAGLWGALAINYVLVLRPEGAQTRASWPAQARVGAAQRGAQL